MTTSQPCSSGHIARCKRLLRRVLSDPQWWIVIVAIAAIVVTILNFRWSNSDFEISVNPMDGTVWQGRQITPAITVKAIYGYKHSVSLSASGHPSGVVITFVPPIGGQTPSYTSTVKINIGSDAPIDKYEIIIKGLGANGKEHTVKYILNIIEKPPPVINITSPKPYEEVPEYIIVSGTFSGELPKGQYMWVVINPHLTPGQWWPQGGRIDPWEGVQWYVPAQVIDPWKGQWYDQAWVGREKEKICKEFDIAVILVDERDDQYYWSYLGTVKEPGSYPSILPLPASAKFSDRSTVLRK